MKHESLQPLIEFKDLQYRYPRTFKKVESFCLQVNDGKIYEGDFIGIVGESGSGKSTLGRLLMNFIEPVSGTLKEKNGLKKQMIFQNPQSYLPQHKTVRWVLEEILRNQVSLDKISSQEKIEAGLRKVGLDSSFLMQRIHSLSGGQAQRVAMLGTLLQEPQLIIADESTSALDGNTQAQIINLWHQLKEHVSLVFILHDLALASYLCNKIWVMYQGNIVEQASAEQIIQNPQHWHTKKILEQQLTFPAIRKC